MGTIKQAVYGDEESSTDITDSLVKMFKKNKYLDIQVGPGLLETKEKGTTATLSRSEQEEIRKQAQESCGNGLDDACMKSRQDSLRASKLAEKAQQEATQTIVGERLTVTVVDPKGKEKQLVIPKDNAFKFGKAPTDESEVGKTWDAIKNAITFTTLGEIGGTMLVAFIWAFGTAFAWVSLSLSYPLPDGGSVNPGEYPWLKYVGAGIALATAGYGGFGVVIGAFIFLGAKYYIGKRSLLFTKQ